MDPLVAAEAVALGAAIGLGAMVATLPLAAVTAIVASESGRRAAGAFTAGWFTGVMGATGAGLLVLDGVGAAAGFGRWVGAVLVALGFALLGFAGSTLVRVARRRGPAPEPKWLGALSGMGLARAFGFGALLAAAKPKNLAIALAAAGSLVSATTDGALQFLGALVFALLVTLGVGAPALALGIFGDRAARPVEALAGWFRRHGDAVIAAVLAVIGGILIIRGLGIV